MRSPIGRANSRRDVGAGAACQVRGQPDRERDLRQLGRLEGERTEREPALRAVDGLGRHQDEDEEKEARAEQRPGGAAKRPVVDPGEHQEGRQADEGVDPLALEVVGGITGRGDRTAGAGAVDHDETERHERQGDDDEEPVLEVRLRPRAAPAALGRSRSRVRRDAAHSASTRARNDSPRCSKSSNWSKLAQAGERSTTSPGAASANAAATAVARSPAIA